MKNYTKKIIVGIFGLVMLLGLAPNSSALSIWNGASNDCSDINIANYTTNTGYGSPCWVGTNINAKDNDVINVRVYYHNTSNVTATNVRIKMFAPTGQSTKHTFSAQITSDQGNLYTGNVYLNTNTKTSLSLVSTKWHPNQSTGDSSLLNGQSNSAVISSSGLSIGSIAPGWNTQGSVNVVFRVNEVEPDVYICTDSQATNYGEQGYCVYPTKTCVINNFSASETSINYYESTKLSWSTSNCSSVQISGVGTVTSTGSRIVIPGTSKTYIISASGNGTSDSDSVYIKVSNGYVDDDEDYCKIDSFTASDTSIEEGDDVTLRWRTTGCDEVNITSLGYVDEDGNEKVSPSSDKTYYIKVYDKDGDLTDSDSIKIYVDEDDDSDDDDDYCKIDSFTADDTSIEKGEEATLKWRTTDCDEVYLSGVGYVNDDDEEDVYPYSRTTYTLKAYGNGVTKKKNVTINVTTPKYVSLVTEPIVSAPIYNNNVVTIVATNVTQTGAQLNGLITDSSYRDSNVYFEYGKTVNLGSRTSSKSANNTNFYDYISGLNSNTIYYFQAISENQSGVSKGAIEVFRTTSIPRTTTNVSTKTTVNKEVVSKTIYGSTSPVILEIENRYKNIEIGDTIDYTVYYKNISSSELENPMVQVYIPEGIVVTNLSDGSYREEDRIVSVPINDLMEGDEGEFYIKAQVIDLNKTLAQVVTTATLIYTNPNGAQENAMAYVLNNPRIDGNNNLGASAFFSGVFGGWDLIGWLLFIILILLLVIIARYLFNRQTEHKNK